MGEAQQRELVKRTAKRTVWFEAAGNQREMRAIKCFHESGVLGRVLDRRRARREIDALRRLGALGFAVPSPIGVERTARGLELSLEWIAGARTLFDLVRGTCEWPAAPEIVARALGELLSLARRHGVTFRDLHAKNILVDARGVVWLVDVAGVVIRGRPGSRREHTRNVVTLLAELREHVPLAWRLRLIAASERESGGRVDRARLVEWNAGARLCRRRDALRLVRRWTRESSVTAEIARGAERGLRSRSIVEAEAWQSLADAEKAVIEGSTHDVLEAWRSAARFVEHALPCCTPLAIRIGGPTPARAVFDDHGATRTLRDRAHAGWRRKAARSLGQLLGALHDRGLALGSPLEISVAFDAEGRARFTPRALPVEIAFTHDAMILVRSAAASATKRERALFVLSFLRAVETTPSHRTRLRELWRTVPTSPREPWRRRVRARALDGVTRAAAWMPDPLVRGALTALSPLAALTRFETLTRSNLELALGAERQPSELDRIARGVRRHAARQFSEWLRLASATTPERLLWIDHIVELDPSVEILQRELARGRGAIVVSAHIGNWELLAARLRRAGHAGAVVGYRRPRDGSARWFERMRERYGVVNIPQSAHPRDILRALEEGRVVGLLADLEVRRLDGEFLPFFGHEALTMTAPAALARAARRPLLPARCVFDAERGRYVLSFEPPLEPDLELDRRARTTDLALRLNAIFERWIREHPEQWAWHQPRWRTRRGDLDVVLLPAHRRRENPLERPRTAPSLRTVDPRLSSD